MLLTYFYANSIKVDEISCVLTLYSALANILIFFKYATT